MATSAQDFVNTARAYVPTYDEAVSYVNNYVSTIQRASWHDVVEDFSHGQITPLTISVALTTVGTIVVLSKVFGRSGTEKKKKKPKKKLTKTQKANREIQAILDYVETEFVPQIDTYVENPKQYLEQDREYKYKYFEEMLLKQLMRLDGVDVSGNDVLRENRKKVIKFVQEHQKRLDAVKKELKF